MATWRELIGYEMCDAGETWSDVVASTLDDVGLDRKFHDGYGSSEGGAFTLWTRRRVYFPVVYDGAEWCASVPRDPCDEATCHVGHE